MKIDVFEDNKLTDEFLEKYSLEDVLLFSYAMPGAQGFQGNIEAIVKLNDNEIGIYSGSFMSDNSKLTMDKVADFFYFIKMNDMNELNNTEWDYLYMGAGNYLFVRREYIEDFKKEYGEFLEKGKVVLYGTWREFTNYLLNVYFNKKDDSELKQKLEEHISIMCDQFSINYSEQKSVDVYTYVSVVYDDDIVATTINEPSFYYKTDLDNISINDKVLVDRNGEEVLGTVIDIEKFDKEDVPFPLDITKKVIKIVEKSQEKEPNFCIDPYEHYMLVIHDSNYNMNNKLSIARGYVVSNETNEMNNYINKSDIIITIGKVDVSKYKLSNKYVININNDYNKGEYTTNVSLSNELEIIQMIQAVDLALFYTGFVTVSLYDVENSINGNIKFKQFLLEDKDKIFKEFDVNTSKNIFLFFEIPYDKNLDVPINIGEEMRKKYKDAKFLFGAVPSESNVYKINVFFEI